MRWLISFQGKLFLFNIKSVLNIIFSSLPFWMHSRSTIYICKTRDVKCLQDTSERGYYLRFHNTFSDWADILPSSSPFTQDQSRSGSQNHPIHDKCHRWVTENHVFLSKKKIESERVWIWNLTRYENYQA